MIRRLLGALLLRTTHLNLLAPDLLAEIVVHVNVDFTTRSYFSKIEHADQQTIGRLAMALIQTGTQFAESHGLKITVNQGNGAPAPVSPPVPA